MSDEKPLPIEYGTVPLSGEVIEKLVPVSDAVVDAWFAETFHGIPLATDYFNRFRAAAEELKKRLAALGG